MREAVVLYHFFLPDEVVSSVLFGDLSAALAKEGWNVTAFPCNRDRRRKAIKYSAAENWNGVRVRRIWRPNFPQISGIGRVLNSTWMVARWCLLAFNPRLHPDVLIVGSDPVFGVIVAIVWRKLKPRTKIVHWCFDLYPEAAVADRILKHDGATNLLLRGLVSRAYRACDLIIDIGTRMKALLKSHSMDTRSETIYPWAIQESTVPDSTNSIERDSIFGQCDLALMYSGSLGRAHSYEDVLAFARTLRESNLKFAFSITQESEAIVRSSLLPDDDNVVLVPMAPRGRISARLSAADIHIVTLREEWTGTVVPSKFFGALSMGRPVLFFGSPQSDIADLIDRHKVGWVVNWHSAEKIASELRRLTECRDELEKMFDHCYRVYEGHFSKDIALGHWMDILHQLVYVKDSEAPPRENVRKPSRGKATRLMDV